MKKRILTAMLAAVMLLGVVSCGNEGGTSADNGSSESTADASGAASGERTGTCEDTGCVWDPYTPYEETVVFTKGASTDTSWTNLPEGDTLTDNFYTRYVKEQVNVGVELAWTVDPNNAKQKNALAIASGEIPDVMVVDRQTFQQLVDNDLVWDMTDAYEKCISPFLKEQYDQYGENLFKHVRVDGRMMGVPGTKITDLHSILWVHQDWLDKVGMEFPQTIDEIKSVAKAFIEQDPGGNGEGKTIGLTATDTLYGGYGSEFTLDTFFAVYGAYPGQWIEKDGGAAYGSIQPEVKEALAEFAQMYKDGILDKEFAVRKSTDRAALVSSGQIGIAVGGMWSPSGVLDSVMNNPEADWTVGPSPLDENGKYKVMENDPLASILVVSKKFEHPEAIIKALNAQYDVIRGNGESGSAAYDECMVDSPGLHYMVSPVELDVSPNFYAKEIHDDIVQALEKDDREAMQIRAFKSVYDMVKKDIEYPKTDKTAYQEHMQRIYGTEATTAECTEDIPCAFFGTTPTMSTKWAALEKLETETFVKIVMGEKSIDEFDAFVDQWLKMGGQEITDEVNDSISNQQ